jgi:hypothetical protein
MQRWRSQQPVLDLYYYPLTSARCGGSDEQQGKDARHWTCEAIDLVTLSDNQVAAQANHCRCPGSILSLHLHLMATNVTPHSPKPYN